MKQSVNVRRQLQKQKREKEAQEIAEIEQRIKSQAPERGVRGRKWSIAWHGLAELSLVLLSSFLRSRLRESYNHLLSLYTHSDHLLFCL